MRRGVIAAVVVLGLTAAVMLVVQSWRDAAPPESTETSTKPRAVESRAREREGGADGYAGDRSRLLQREIAAAEQRVAALAGEIAAIRTAGETVEHLVERCRNGGFDCPSHDVPQALLEAWAECGTLRSDGFYYVMRDDDAERHGVTEPERQRILEIGLALQEADLAREETITREATGDEPPAQPPGVRIVNANSDAIRDATLDPAEIRKKLAREAAGLQEPPEDPDSGSPYERLLRMRQSKGRRFLEALERELGADRARELAGVLPQPGTPWGGECRDR